MSVFHKCVVLHKIKCISKTFIHPVIALKDTVIVLPECLNIEIKRKISDQSRVYDPFKIQPFVKYIYIYIYIYIYMQVYVCTYIAANGFFNFPIKFNKWENKCSD